MSDLCVDRLIDLPAPPPGQPGSWEPAALAASLAQDAVMRVATRMRAAAEAAAAGR